MPGLLRSAARTAARTAVIASTASAVSGRVQERQARRWGAPARSVPAPVPQTSYPETPRGPAPQAGRSTGDTLQQLKTLGDLKAQGVLTEQEFAAQKAKILAG